MQEKTCKTVRLCYGIALSLMTAVTGALFIWQTLDIYLSGGSRPFTREIVLERLNRIAPAFWIWVVMVAVGFIIWEVFAVSYKRAPLKDDCYALRRLKKRVPQKVGESGLASLKAVKRGELINLIVKLCAAALCLAGVAYGIAYLATSANFPKTDVNGEMLNMAAHLAPCVFAALLILCGVTLYLSISAKKQLPHVKQLIASAKADEKNGVEAVYVTGNTAVADLYGRWKALSNHKYFILGVRIAIAVFAVTFIILGIVNGNMRAILIKAINICTECIGLG
ncbi:MAG: hypothetical protein HFK03_00965 [Clostridia bacterium]|nr:hypothetical protein [Clostridia bacterium]